MKRETVMNKRIAKAITGIIMLGGVVSMFLIAPAASATANPGGATLTTQSDVPGNTCYFSWVANQDGTVSISPASGKNSNVSVLSLDLEPQSGSSLFSTAEVNVIGGQPLANGEYKASLLVDGKRVAQTKAFSVNC
jgi:hypothetical protein